jgi:hypothetical protein
MIYFYLWVVFLVSILLALPIVAMMEKSRAKKLAGARSQAAEKAVDQSQVLDDAVAEQPAADAALDEFGQAVPAGADDFSAFDDFK